MFFDEPTYLSDPDCQAHFVPALSSIFWGAVSIPTKQFEWFEIHGKWYIDKRVLFLFSGLESEIVHFSVVFIDLPQALINFSMIFMYCPWFSMIYPRCLTISSWLSSMFSMGFIHVHWFFHCFHQPLQSVDRLSACVFFFHWDFSMMFSDFSMIGIDVQLLSSISPRCSLVFSQHYPCFSSIFPWCSWVFTLFAHGVHWFRMVFLYISMVCRYFLTVFIEFVLGVHRCFQCFYSCVHCLSVLHWSVAMAFVDIYVFNGLSLEPINN